MNMEDTFDLRRLQSQVASIIEEAFSNMIEAYKEDENCAEIVFAIFRAADDLIQAKNKEYQDKYPQFYSK